MGCPEQLLGAEAWFVAITITVGALVRGWKRLLPKTPAALLPFIALALGYLLDAGGLLVLCDVQPATAAMGGLGGAFAGLAAAGGHELLARLLNPIIGAELTGRLLGKMQRAHLERLRGQAKR